MNHNRNLGCRRETFLRDARLESRFIFDCSHPSWQIGFKKKLITPETNIIVVNLYLISLRRCRPDFCPVKLPCFA